jgi:hypothetical protein
MKKADYLEHKGNQLEAKGKVKNNTASQRLNECNKCYQPTSRPNFVNDENGDLLAVFHINLNTWKYL